MDENILGDNRHFNAYLASVASSIADTALVGVSLVIADPTRHSGAFVSSISFNEEGKDFAAKVFGRQGASDNANGIKAAIKQDAGTQDSLAYNNHSITHIPLGGEICYGALQVVTKKGYQPDLKENEISTEGRALISTLNASLEFSGKNIETEFNLYPFDGMALVLIADVNGYSALSAEKRHILDSNLWPNMLDQLSDAYQFPIWSTAGDNLVMIVPTKSANVERNASDMEDFCRDLSRVFSLTAEQLVNHALTIKCGLGLGEVNYRRTRSNRQQSTRVDAYGTAFTQVGRLLKEANRHTNMLYRTPDLARILDRPATERLYNPSSSVWALLKEPTRQRPN